MECRPPLLDFCAEHGIVVDIELIGADEINNAYERMLKGDVPYRFVIDNAMSSAWAKEPSAARVCEVSGNQGDRHAPLTGGSWAVRDGTACRRG